MLLDHYQGIVSIQKYLLNFQPRQPERIWSGSGFPYGPPSCAHLQNLPRHYEIQVSHQHDHPHPAELRHVRMPPLPSLLLLRRHWNGNFWRQIQIGFEQSILRKSKAQCKFSTFAVAKK